MNNFFNKLNKEKEQGKFDKGEHFSYFGCTEVMLRIFSKIIFLSGKVSNLIYSLYFCK